MSQDLIIVLGCIAGYLCQAVVLHDPKVSSSVSLLCAHILLLLFIFHFFNIFLLIPGGTWSLWVSGASGVLCPTCVMYWAGFFFWHCLLPRLHDTEQEGGIPCLFCLSGPHVWTVGHFVYGLPAWAQ